ncbi:MAG: hypothetical protein AAFO89_03345 [Planctomycetota bacterium]
MNEAASPDGSWPTLCPADERALEWLLNNELDPSNAPSEFSMRAHKLAGLFQAAGEADVDQDDSLRDAVLDRLLLVGGPTAALSEADEDAVDATVMAGLDASRVPGALRGRAERVVSLVSLLDGPKVVHDAALTDRVLAAVDGAVAPVGTERPVLARISGRLADIVSIAAVLLISASVVWPVMSTVRTNAMRNANQANLAVAGVGLGAYAADFADHLPRVRTPEQQRRWWDVNPHMPRSNASNLFSLVRLQYTPEQALKSPGNEHAPTGPLPADAVDWQDIRQVSYSYLLPIAGRNEASSVGVVLADRSPIMLRLLAGEVPDASENSPNHDGRGQHMLRGDGSVIWSTEPRTQYGDHIYLPRSVEQAVEFRRWQMGMPAWHTPELRHYADVFLGP